MQARRTHPWVFLVLIIPFGAMSGYLTVTLAWILRQAGMSVGAIAALVAASYVPHTWKFLWAPIVDSTFTRRGWYALASVVTGVGIWGIGVIPHTAQALPVMTGVVIAANVAVTFLGMSVESLMAHSVDEHQKGRASGWFNAGSLGGTGVGGGLALWLAQRLPQASMAGAVLGALCVCCMAALPLVAEPHSAHRTGSLWRTLGNVLLDLWGVVRSRRGLLGMMLCFLPIGTGAASNLWSAVAGEWHASANAVALATGLMSGVFAAIGCLLAGWLLDRMDRKVGYAVFGLVQAGILVAMAFGPRSQLAYVVWTSAYAMFTGFSFAGFSAFTLETIGAGAAATKYNVFAALANWPIAIVTGVDGRAHDRWGSRGMLFAEAALAGASMAVFFGLRALLQRGSAVIAGGAAIAAAPPADGPQ